MARLGWSTSNFLRLSSALVTTTPLSISAWAVTSITTGSQTIAGVYSPSTGWFNLFVSTASVAVSTATPTASTALTTTAITANVWFHACGVWASATDRRAFLNGGGKGTNAISRIPTGLDRVSMGILDGTAVSSPWAPAGTGLIAEVGIWNTTLSDADVARLATGISCLAVQREFLVGHWPLLYGGSEFNRVNPGAPMLVNGALTVGAGPPAFFMPNLQPRLLRL